VENQLFIDSCPGAPGAIPMPRDSLFVEFTTFSLGNEPSSGGYLGNSAVYAPMGDGVMPGFSNIPTAASSAAYIQSLSAQSTQPFNGGWGATWWGSFISNAYWGAGAPLDTAGVGVANTFAHPVNSYNSAVNATSSVMAQNLENGGNGVTSLLTGLSYDVSSGTGAAQILQGVYGVNLVTDQNLTGMQRAQYIIGGAGQAGLTAAGLAGAYNGAAGLSSFQLSKPLGDLTPVEVSAIQRIVDNVGLPLKVGGSAARAARGLGSDIDYIAQLDHLDAWDAYAPALPGIDASHGILPEAGGGSNWGARILFAPGTSPTLIK
jgi:hypothetical protein